MKNVEKLFDANSFSEKAMPFSSALGKLLDEAYRTTVSDDVSACMSWYSDMNDRFFDSLNDEQGELFEKLGYVIGKISETEETEHFNMGFKCGVVLMAELFGKS